jgi:hypothetical protein
MKYCRMLSDRIMFTYVRYSLLYGLPTCSSPVSGSTVSSSLSLILYLMLGALACWFSCWFLGLHFNNITLYIMANMSRSLTCERDADDNRQPPLCQGHDWHSLRLHSLKIMLWFSRIISVSILLYSEIASSWTSGRVSSRPFLTLFLRVAGAHWIITYHGERIAFRSLCPLSIPARLVTYLYEYSFPRPQRDCSELDILLPSYSLPCFTILTLCQHTTLFNIPKNILLIPSYYICKFGA